MFYPYVSGRPSLSNLTTLELTYYFNVTPTSPHQKKIPQTNKQTKIKKTNNNKDDVVLFLYIYVFVYKLK